MRDGDDKNDAGDAPDQAGRRGVEYPVWKKMQCLYATVLRMSIREKRKIFALIRKHPDATHDTLLVRHGMTLGEFCSMHVLAESHRKAGSG